jgi:hypothetical protein
MVDRADSRVSTFFDSPSDIAYLMCLIYAVTSLELLASLMDATPSV